MKCDELTLYHSKSLNLPIYVASKVDAAITELKEKLHDVDNQWNEQCKEIAQLKAENESLKAKLETVNELVKTSKDMYDRTIESLKASHYAEMVDAGMRERRLRRALCLTRVKRAYAEAKYNHQMARRYEEHKEHTIANCFDATVHKWQEVERKCLKKAEEYK